MNAIIMKRTVEAQNLEKGDDGGGSTCPVIGECELNKGRISLLFKPIFAPIFSIFFSKIEDG